MSQNPLTMRDFNAANELIRTRLEEKDRELEVEVAKRRRREAAEKAAEEIPDVAWERAFEACILYYEKIGATEMADLLRLDLDRYVRRERIGDQVEWAARKDKAG